MYFGVIKIEEHFCRHASYLEKSSFAGRMSFYSLIRKVMKNKNPVGNGNMTQMILLFSLNNYHYCVTNIYLEFFKSIFSIHFLIPPFSLSRSWCCLSVNLATVGVRRGTPWTGHQCVTGPHHHSPIHTLCHTQGKVRVTNEPLKKIFGWWEEA